MSATDALKARVKYVVTLRDLHGLDDTPGKTHLKTMAEKQGKRLLNMGFKELAKVFGAGERPRESKK